ncbi:LamG domain-containing protein [Candidatus Woesearchaeota archaeon]|nr:LamG domain-containing protein [Candidatus Woesearchaeota archaeon]
MKCKRGAYNQGHSMMIFGIIVLVALVALLVTLPPKYKYSEEIFENEFISDDFGVIDGSEIRFFDIGIEAEDFLLVNGREHEIDQEMIDGVLIRKESISGGRKIIYGMKNQGGRKELQFIWKCHIPEEYDAANRFDLRSDFIDNSPFVRLYSEGVYKSYVTFEDVVQVFGELSLSYDAGTRVLTASSSKLSLEREDEIILDPGAGPAELAPSYNDEGFNPESIITGGVAVKFEAPQDTFVPSVSFESPTPENNSIQSSSSAEINISVKDTNLERLVLDWNGTARTFDMESLALMLNFDNVDELGEDDTLVKDLSYAGNDGSIIGAGYAGGRYGFSLMFDGEGDKVAVDDRGDLNLDEFTIEFFFMPEEDYDSGSGRISIVSDEDYEIYLYQGKMVFECKGTKVISSTSSWAAGTWYHIAVSYGSVQTIYVDNVKQSLELIASSFSFEDPDGAVLASFLDSGDILLKGSCISGGGCSVPGEDAFIIQSSGSETTAYLDSAGNLCISDASCSDNDMSCSGAAEGSFIITDSDGTIVSYINSAGGLCLKGDLKQNAFG